MRNLSEANSFKINAPSARALFIGWELLSIHGASKSGFVLTVAIFSILDGFSRHRSCSRDLLDLSRHWNDLTF